MDITINYWAVLVAAIVNMIVGTVWYGPVFGKTWRRLIGFTEESMKNMPLTAPQAMFGGSITSLLMSYVLAHFAFIAGAVSASDAFELAFWIWLGFFFTTSASVFLWEGKSYQLFLFNAAEQLVALVGMALVLVLWQ